MKQSLTFFLVLSLSTLSLQAQQFEIRGILNSGLYSYGGDGAESISRINSRTYTNDPYGSKNAFSYGFGLNIRKVTKRRFLFGAEFGYEMLRSKVHLKYQDVVWGDILSAFEGRTYLNNSFLNLFPYLGGRFEIGGQALDVTGGLDAAYLLSSREKGKATSDVSGEEVRTSRDRRGIKTDFRPRIQLSTDFGKIGFYVGYSHGLRNYKENFEGTNDKVYSRMIRMGISYLLVSRQ